MLFDQVKRTIDCFHLLEKGDRVILGVSAGVDSMVLLHLFLAFREAFDLSLIIAHVNHGFRPEESEKEADLVQKECTRLKLPYEYGQFDVKEFQKLGGLSPQDAARKVRFHFLYNLFQKHHAQKIALGHHAEDQVETVLLRLFRGSGLQGLKGMLPMREGKVIRPLLEVGRREIESFAIEKKIPFLLDSSNLKKDYLRNRIRLALIPLIEKEYQPHFREAVLRTSNLLSMENDYVEKGAEEAYQQIVQQEGKTLSFKFSEYQSLHQAIQGRMIKKILEMMEDGKIAPEEGYWPEVRQICQKLYQPSPSFQLALPNGRRVEKHYDTVLCRRGGDSSLPPFEAELQFPGQTFIPEIGKRVVIEETNQERLSNHNVPSTTAVMDYHRLQFPLRMRNFRPGDRFQPLGVKGTQKLKEFFIDHKVPRFERPKIPLLMSGEMIAWVVGYRIDERVRITEKTKKVLKVTIV